MRDTRAHTRANYDRLSRWYDLIAGAAERAFARRGLARLDLRPGERVLEIGAGTGALLAELVRHVRLDGAAWGVNLSMGMCRVAHARLARAGMLPGGAVVCGDAVRLPCPTAACDAIFMSFTLELFPDAAIAQVLAECRRVRRPHGRVGIVALAETGESGRMPRLYAWAHRERGVRKSCY